MASLFRKLIKGTHSTKVISTTQRLLRTSTVVRELDGDPVPNVLKIKVDFIGQDTSDVTFQSFSPTGFKLNNGIRISGSCIAFPKAFLQWKVDRGRDLTPEHFALFPLLVPKPDVLIIGVGDQKELDYINPEIIKYLRQNRLNLELLTTPKAVAAFNYLNSEQRIVAAALIPSKHDSVLYPEPKPLQPDFEIDKPDMPHVEYGRQIPAATRELRQLRNVAPRTKRIKDGVNRD